MLPQNDCLDHLGHATMLLLLWLWLTMMNCMLKKTRLTERLVLMMGREYCDAEKKHDVAAVVLVVAAAANAGIRDGRADVVVDIHSVARVVLADLFVRLMQLPDDDTDVHERHSVVCVSLVLRLDYVGHVDRPLYHEHHPRHCPTGQSLGKDPGEQAPFSEED